MKKLLTLFAFAALVFAFTGCSDDDDEVNPIVGTWLNTNVYDPTNSYTTEAAAYKNQLVMFKADGTFVGTFIGITNTENAGTYTFNNGLMTLNYGNGTASYSFYYTLDENSLILSYKVDNNERYNMKYARQ